MNNDPNSVEFWLDELRRRSWSLYFFGRDRIRPELIAAVWRWPYCADVVILRAESDATAFRTPTGHDVDVFAAQWVNWIYAGCAVWTLRAALTLPEPGSPAAPMQIMTTPAACRIPHEQRQPFSFRPTAHSPALHTPTGSADPDDHLRSADR